MHFESLCVSALKYKWQVVLEHMLMPVSRWQNMFSVFLLKNAAFLPKPLLLRRRTWHCCKKIMLQNTFSESRAICIVLRSIDVNNYPLYIDKPFLKSRFCLGDNTFVIEWFAGINCIILGLQIPVLPRSVSGAVKRVFATVKWYNLCLQIIQTQIMLSPF